MQWWIQLDVNFIGIVRWQIPMKINNCNSQFEMHCWCFDLIFCFCILFLCFSSISNIISFHHMSLSGFGIFSVNRKHCYLIKFRWISISEMKICIEELRNNTDEYFSCATGQRIIWKFQNKCIEYSLKLNKHWCEHFLL